MEFKVENDRIYCENNDGKIVAQITFPEIKEGVYDINHTFVDESLRGQNIGKKLVQMAIEEIEKKNGKIEATCSYAKHYIEKNLR